MGANPGLDNGEAFMRANRALHDAQQQLNLYPGAPTPGERPEPEDITGLRLLEDFLAKRKGARDD